MKTGTIRVLFCFGLVCFMILYYYEANQNKNHRLPYPVVQVLHAKCQDFWGSLTRVKRVTLGSDPKVTF